MANSLQTLLKNLGDLWVRFNKAFFGTFMPWFIKKVYWFALPATILVGKSIVISIHLHTTMNHNMECQQDEELSI